ncbi:Sperm protein associated with the nucleus on the X chromosome [Sporothrix curviconia]|uniref:Sperm protein associated with the nucleus on the X chromosome n=1 Tax=Sporothrix curviconia TaxID=1260050 RepID=A0ABP0CDA7_9PEZI
MAAHQPIMLKKGLLFGRQVGVSISNPFSTGPSGFPGSGDGANTGSGSRINTGSGSSSSGTDTASGSVSGDATTTGTPFGSSYGAGDGSDSSSSSSSSSHGPSTAGLSQSNIAGIALGSILFVLIVLGFLTWFCTRKRRPQQHGDTPAGGEHPGRHGEETVAFAKVNSQQRRAHSQHELPDLPGLPDDPPAYEEIGQHGANVPHGSHPLQQQGHDIHNDIVLGSVPDGFRQYDAQPPAMDSGAKDGFGLSSPGEHEERPRPIDG